MCQPGRKLSCHFSRVFKCNKWAVGVWRSIPHKAHFTHSSTDCCRACWGNGGWCRCRVCGRRCRRRRTEPPRSGRAPAVAAGWPGSPSPGWCRRRSPRSLRRTRSEESRSGWTWPGRAPAAFAPAAARSPPAAAAPGRRLCSRSGTGTVSLGFLWRTKSKLAQVKVASAESGAPLSRSKLVVINMHRFVTLCSDKIKFAHCAKFLRHKMISFFVLVS